MSDDQAGADKLKSDDVGAQIRALREELEKTNALLTRFALPCFALLVILVVLAIVHR